MFDSVQPYRRQHTRLPRPWDSPGKNTGAGCHFLLQCMKVKSEREVAQSCPTLRNPIYCNLPGSSVHGIFQARVLEWGAIPFSDIIATECLILELYIWKVNLLFIFVVVQSLSCVRLFVTPWTAAGQASLSFTICQSLVKLMSIDSVLPSNHLILCPPPASPALSLPSIRVFANESLFMSDGRRIGASSSASVFPVNIQGWFPLRLTGLTSCCPRDSQESSPTSQLKASVLQCSAFFIFQLVLLLNYFFHSVASQFVRPQNSANLD